MASGRQLAEKNHEIFVSWVESKNDDDFRALASRGVLSRTEIAKECGFAKSALAQNPRIRDALRELEDALRARGVLPPAAAVPLGVEAEPPLRQSDGTRSAREAERLKRLEQENASLRAENSELKKQLERYAVLHEALSLTGRVPR
jgi:hypothetical protein